MVNEFLGGLIPIIELKLKGMAALAIS